MYRWKSILILLATLLSLTNAACYLRNGTDRNSIPPANGRGFYNPCDSNASGASMCCNNVASRDTCAPIGRLAQSLCWNVGGSHLWRESCTDPSWKDVNCVKLFMNDSQTDITVTNCSRRDGHGNGFCWGDNNWGCCLAGQAVFIDPDTGEQVDRDPSLPPIESPTPGLSTGAKAGIGVGVALGVGLLLCIGIYVFMKRKNKRRSHYDVPPPRWGAVEADQKQKLELDGTLYSLGQGSQTTEQHNDHVEAHAVNRYPVEMPAEVPRA